MFARQRSKTVQVEGQRKFGAAFLPRHGAVVAPARVRDVADAAAERTPILARSMHGRCISLMMVIVMNDQSVSLALGVATLFFEFALDLALTGDPDHAFRFVSSCRKTEQDDQEATENLFWD